MTRNQRTGLRAGAMAVAMLGAAYAAVPLYQMFCQVTGFGGTTQRADDAVAAAVRPVEREITVRFDANTMPSVPWRFRPEQNTQKIRIGQRMMAFYAAENLSSRPTSGQASFNVSPDTVGKYFVKIDCFCFVQQTLEARQKVAMPVLYYIDPAILDDADAMKVEEVTLSYTFFPMEAAPAKTAADARSDKTQG